MMAGRLSRSLTAALRVMMVVPPSRGIMTSQKVYPPLRREAELLTLYKRAFTQGGRTQFWLKACVHLAATWIIGTQGLNIGAVCGNFADSVAGKDIHTFQKPLIC
ncbi:hypothetical protein CK203_090486 [Vitis vinifera]|uniref:Uncharacterized protein n=1 Tax=Vitis vinifera TaxID=29760 RepID=A0A438BTT7_VITVI|nr:hypothetical protein CK203_090486 [Vitis vinifera]